MTRLMKTSGALLALLALSGCASIVSKSVYPVAVSSQPSGATYEIINQRTGRVVSAGVTPQTVMLNASNGFFSRADYAVTFTQDGYHGATQPLRAGLDGWYFGNILFGGLLGVLIIDPATGAMWKLDQQVFTQLAAKPLVPVVPPLAPAREQAVDEPAGEIEASIVPQDSVTLMHLDQVPGSWRPYLVPVI